MSNPVSTGIGDHFSRVCHSVIFSRHLSLAIPSWVGEMSTGDGFGRRWMKKRRVLRSSGPSYQDCWHTGLVYASLIGSDHRQLRGQSGWASSRRSSQSVHKSFLSSDYLKSHQLQEGFALSFPPHWRHFRKPWGSTRPTTVPIHLGTIQTCRHSSQYLSQHISLCPSVRSTRSSSVPLLCCDLELTATFRIKLRLSLYFQIQT